jgi:hypothetical protein
VANVQEGAPFSGLTEEGAPISVLILKCSPEAGASKDGPSSWLVIVLTLIEIHDGPAAIGGLGVTETVVCQWPGRAGRDPAGFA